MRYKLTTTLTAAALLLSAGMASAQTVMRLGINDEPHTIDPALGEGFGNVVVLTTFCEKLFDIDENLDIVPRLAESYEWSQDGKVLTLKLRPNLVFHDGEPLDAEAVKYNFERNMTIEGSFRKVELARVASVEVVDPLTVRVNLSAPSAPLMSNLVTNAGMMISPKAAKEMGANFGTKPVCAGPFKFVSRVPQGRMVFEKFDRYWDVENVHIDRLEILAVNDASIRLSNLQSGEFDIIERLSPTDAKRVEGDSKLKLVTSPELGYGYIQFNLDNGPRSAKMKDQRVREAIDLSIDRQTLVNVAFDGLYKPGGQSIAPGSFYHDETRPVPGRDIERAKQLLKEAGQENFTFEMLVRPDRDFLVPAQIMQAMMAEAGINMVINMMETVTQLDAARQGNFESYIAFWSGRIDPDGNTFSFYVCGEPQNRMGYCNDEVDELLKAAHTEMDPAKRKELYKKAMDIKDHDRPDLSLWHRQLFAASRANVEGLRLLPDGLIRLVGVSIK